MGRDDARREAVASVLNLAHLPARWWQVGNRKAFEIAAGGLLDHGYTPVEAADLLSSLYTAVACEYGE